jgi:pyruvate,water dikinase
VSDWVLSYFEALAAGPAVVGGKAWNLARLGRYGFQVPPGGVLVADAYRAVRAGANPPIEQSVREFLERAGLADVPLAVRSSATAEDSSAVSFAGVHDSVLDVRGAAAVLDAIDRCYASLWTPRASAYRRRLALADEAVACAVLLCQMAAPPIAAGVAFSCDPRTGRRDRLAISAAPGRGEAVAQGTVAAEEISVSIAHAPFVVADRRGPRVLSDEAALRLARLVVRIEWALGDGEVAQDVEWLFDGQTFWIVQARPVTALPRVSVPLAAAVPVTWTNGNLSEVIAGVPTVGAWSLIAPFLRHILLTGVASVGYPVPPGLELVRRFDGRPYLDLTCLQAVFFDALGTSPQQSSRNLGGPPSAVPVPAGDPLRVGRRRGARLRLLAKIVALLPRYPRAIGRLRARAAVRGRVDPRQLSNAQLVAQALDITRDQLAFGRTFQLGNLACGAWPQLLEQLLEQARPGHGQRLSTALMTGAGGVVTAEHGYAIYDLAAAAAADPVARASLADADGWRRLPPSSPYRQALDRFLDAYGHRGLDEAELASPRWREDPSYVLDQVRVLVETGAYAQPSPRVLARDRRYAAEAEVNELPLATRWPARLLAWLSRHTAAQREAGKSALIAMVEPIRAIVLEVGHRLEVDAVHLAWWDIEAYLRSEWDGRGARELVEDRKRLREEQLRRPAPPGLIVTGVSPKERPPSGGDAARAGMALPVRRGLHGLAVSAGRACGPARILLRPQDGSRLRPGDVLVAPSTDPGWTPLFLRAAAVATEVGGYLSHTAIVAREYGLPAVVNVPGLLAAVRDGQPIIVDGNTGTIERSS